MRRDRISTGFVALVALLAAFVLLEPVIHTHPLSSQSGSRNQLETPNVCAVCAVGTASIVVENPTFGAPPASFELLVLSAATSLPTGAALPTPSRAPPAQA